MIEPNTCRGARKLAISVQKNEPLSLIAFLIALEIIQHKLYLKVFRMIRKSILILSVLALTACTDPNGARNTAESHGFRNVETTGYRFFGCSDNDLYRTGFTAIAPNGRRVTGVVCSALFKGNTLRLD